MTAPTVGDLMRLHHGLVARVQDLEDQITMHEEANGVLADTARAARDEAEWMRAELLRLARSMGPTGGWVAPILRIAAGPPAEDST